MIKPRRVEATGPVDSKIVLVGEAPGKEEDLTGVPFTGSSGTLLTQIMREAGINRAECYITNVVKHRPPNNDLDRLGEIGLNLQECEEELRQELGRLNPNVIVPLGNVPLHAITGKGMKPKDTITNWRGSIIPSYPSMGNGSPLKVIPTLHPAYIMRDWDSSPLSLFDFQKIKRESEFPDFRSIKKKRFTIAKTFERAMIGLQDLLQVPAVSLDIETYKYTDIIKCVGFSSSSDSALCIPIVEKGKDFWSPTQEGAIWDLIRSILTCGDIKKVIQNMGFEMEMLFKYVGEINPVYMDTMIASHLYLPEIKKALSMQTSIYTNEPYYKTEAHDANYDPQALYEYNCKDTSVTFEIYEYLEARLKEDDLHNFLHGFQMPLGRVLWRATHTGVLIDQEKVKQYKEETEEKLKKVEEELEKEVGYLPDVNSPTKMCKLLYQELGYPPQFKLSKTTKGKKKSKTVDEKALLKLNRLYPNKIFDLILEVRGYRKLLSTYLHEFWDEDGRCRADFKLTGAKTGRLSSTQNVRGTGLQLQNIPKWMRDIFISDPGCLFLKVDLSQVESRLVAYLAENLTMMQSFEEGKDIHSTVGSMLHSKEYEDCGKGTPERQEGKKTGHSANYHISPQRLHEETGFPLARCKELLYLYYQKFNLGKWWQSIIDQLKTDRTLITPHGRRRIFYGRWPTWKEEQEQKGDLLKAAYANVPQGTACDHINLAGVRIFHRLPESGVILIQCHDELVMQFREGLEGEVERIVREELEQPLYINGREVVIPVDIEIGRDWKMA